MNEGRPEPAEPTAGEATTPDDAADRRAGEDRRRTDRRREQVPVPVERRSGVDRRQQPDRRRSINQYDLGADELEFVQAIHQFKERTGKAFPTWSDVLRILRTLGYEKRA